MSQTDMDAMMYKIEGEDLYLIGTSEHSMIGKFIDQIIPERKLPQTLTSYSPCFRKEKGSHGIEERGRVPHPPVREAGDDRGLQARGVHGLVREDVAVVRGAVPLSGHPRAAAGVLLRGPGGPEGEELRHRGVVSPAAEVLRVCSCSNLGDAQARRLKIRVKGENGKNYLPHTLNNTVVAPPRMLIAFLENNLQADGTVTIPAVLRPYMGGKEKLVPKG